ncbi:MAG: TAXI family TRAP transporter solute-binding subunit, partial [Dehalococcoidia bacterium]|nr:TAXI family TRAP transporter solute-binding subunit [Dehalococcoidia bacterium]
IIYPSGAGGALFIELATTTQVKWVPIEDAAVKKISDKYPFLTKQVLPAGTYPGQTQDVPWIGVSTMTVTRDDIPESLVYAVTKTLWEHLDEFKSMHPAAKEWAIGDVLEERTIPWHPGAIKYYKEKGLWNSELDKLQKNFLAEGK